MILWTYTEEDVREMKDSELQVEELRYYRAIPPTYFGDPPKKVDEMRRRVKAWGVLSREVSRRKLPLKPNAEAAA